MLSDAIRDINDRLRIDERERRRRAAVKASLREAETYAHRLEELLLRGQDRVPDDLAQEARRFVLRHSPRTAPGARNPVWTHAAPLLDFLFDLEEVLQVMQPLHPGASVAVVEAA
jgi:hypothetical protein